MIDQLLRLLTFSDANVRYVFSGMMLLGAAGGVLGSFTLLRKRALIGDALAHSALPGIGVAFLITGAKSMGALLTGAAVAGLIGVVILLAIRRMTRIKEDAALAIILTVFFGIGIVLLTYIQKTGSGSQSGLDKFLFGQSAAITKGEVEVIGMVAVLLIVLSIIFFKELKLLCFDSAFADVAGFSVLALDIFLMSLTVGVIVIGLQAVGVVLMAALLIIPSVTARLWTNRLHMMLVIAALIGAVSGALGSALSFLAPRMPSGPLTVLSGSSLFLISLLFAPGRGVVSRIRRRFVLAMRTGIENLLRAVAELAEFNDRPLSSAFEAAELAEIRGWSDEETVRKLGLLRRKKLALARENGSYKLTEYGAALSRRLLHRHRLWELYLIHQADIAVDHVHRDADDVEHFLTPEIEKRLIELAGEDAVSPASPHPIIEGVRREMTDNV